MSFGVVHTGVPETPPMSVAPQASPGRPVSPIQLEDPPGENEQERTNKNENQDITKITERETQETVILDKTTQQDQDIRQSPKPKQRRGRPRKPNPITSMTADTLIRTNKRLRMCLFDGDRQIGQFDSALPRQTKSGKVGWAFSQKIFVDVGDVSVACQLTANMYGIRSDRWGQA